MLLLHTWLPQPIKFPLHSPLEPLSICNRSLQRCKKSAARCLRVRRKHVKMCHKTGTLAKHYCHQSRRSACISTAMARLGLFLCIALPVFCSLCALSGYNSQIAPNRAAPQPPQRIVEEPQGVLYCSKRSPKTHRTVRTKSIRLCFSSTAKNTCKKIKVQTGRKDGKGSFKCISMLLKSQKHIHFNEQAEWLCVHNLERHSLFKPAMSPCS